MTYSKPEVTILGEASRVIQGNKSLSGIDSVQPFNTQPAYELDE